MIFDEEEFYEHEPSETFWCGSCARDAILKTHKGEYRDDEAMHEHEFRRLTDSDTEAYQCENCNLQSEGYDSVLDDD